MHKLEKRILLPEDLKPINSLAEYKERGGLKGLENARNMTQHQLIKEVMKSKLRGRGGAGFPTGVKWETVYEDPYPTKYVVCNGAEGEPGTYKDRYLISKNPYLVLEGMLIASHAVGAKQAIIGTKKKFTHTVERLKGALEEFLSEGVCEPGYIKIVLGPDDYLFGEEKALLEVIDGRDPMPRMFPPFMVGVGVKPNEPNPSVVNNAESMSHLPNILRNGADWFRGLGTEDTPGTMILTLSGDVKKPGMYEVELGLTLRELIYELGEGPATDTPIKAVFSGVANPVATPDLFDTVLDFGSMRNAGIGLGSGGFIVHDENDSGVKLALMYSDFLAGSSCGQCIPCNMGTRVVTEHLEKLASGRGSQDDIDSILVECGRCTNQTRCFLPVQESKLVPSCIESFSDEFTSVSKRNKIEAREPLLAKIENFDEQKGQFVYEKQNH